MKANSKSKAIKALVGICRLAGPLIILLAALAGYVHIHNQGGKETELSTGMESPVIWPWQNARYLISINLPEPGGIPPAPLDLIIAIDVSPSVGDSLPAFKIAAERALKNLAARNRGGFRAGLISFDSDAKVLAPLGADPSEVVKSLKRARPLDAGFTDAGRAFALITDLISQAPARNRKCVLFFTDGRIANCPRFICPKGSSEEDLIQQAKALRKKGVNFFSLGLPGMSTTELMIRICGGSGRVRDALRPTDLTKGLMSLTGAFEDASGSDAVLALSLNHLAFSPERSSTDWSRDANGGLVQHMEFLAPGQMEIPLDLVPLGTGLWQVEQAPCKLTYITPQGNLRVISARTHPKALVISWWLLALALAPGLLWLLVRLALGRGEEKPASAEPALPPAPATPRPQPRLPASEPERLAATPTYFIGLGRAGLKALINTHAFLAQDSRNMDAGHHRFVHLGLTGRDGFPPASAIPEAVETHQAPDYCGSPLEVFKDMASDGHLGWFPFEHYLDRSREGLTLAGSAADDRVLARLALFAWLADKDNSPVEWLAHDLKSFFFKYTAVNPGRLVILASGDGGVGSGWLIDLGLIIRRLARRIQGEGNKPIWDNTAVLMRSEGPAQGRNLLALSREISSTRLLGAHPQRTTFVRGHSLLDRVDSEHPFDTILITRSQAALDAAARKAGEAASILAYTDAGARLLNLAGEVSQRPCEVRIDSLLTPGGLFRVQAANSIMRCFFSPDVIPGLTRATSEDYSEVIENWRESTGSPWAALMDRLELLAEPWETVGESDEIWLNRCLIVALNHTLCHLKPDEGGLTGLVHTLKALTITVAGLEDQSREPGRFTCFSQTLKQAISGLDAWLDRFENLLEELAADRAALEKECRAVNKETPGVILTAQSGFDDKVLTSGIKTWLGAEDLAKGLSERLFLRAVMDDGALKLLFEIHLSQVLSFEQDDGLMKRFAFEANSLVEDLPPLTLAGALASANQEDVASLAGRLGRRREPGLPSLLIIPPKSPVAAVGGRQLEDLILHLAGPRGRRALDVVACDDLSAIRSLLLTPARISGDFTSAPFNRMGEVKALEVMRLFSAKFRIEPPSLPAGLRLALGDVERFQRFAEAYTAGRISRAPDSFGRLQWALYENQLLTHSRDSLLWQAAASFPAEDAKTGQPRHQGESPHQCEAPDFSSFWKWLETDQPADDLALTLAAVGAFVSWEGMR